MIEQLLTDVAFVTKELAPESLRHRFDGFSVVDVAGRQGQSQQIAAFVDDQVQLEPVKPAHGTFADLGQPLEDAVALDPFIVADLDRGRVDEADPGNGPQTSRHQVGQQRHHGLWDQVDESFVADQVGKILAMVDPQVQIKVLEGSIVAGLESDEDRHDLADAHPAVTPAATVAIG